MTVTRAAWNVAVIYIISGSEFTRINKFVILVL